MVQKYRSASQTNTIYCSHSILSITISLSFMCSLFVTHVRVICSIRFATYRTRVCECIRVVNRLNMIPYQSLGLDIWADIAGEGASPYLTHVLIKVVKVVMLVKVCRGSKLTLPIADDNMFRPFLQNC